MNPIDENGKELAYAMKQVLDGTEPILKVVHDAYGDWQFIGITDANSKDGRLVHSGHFLEIDPTVREVMDLPTGWEAVRHNVSDKWERVKSKSLEKNDSKIFVSKDSPYGKYSGFFEDEGETGYLYIYDGDKVIKHLQIYNKSREINLEEKDVNILWSKDGQKCAVVIWGGIQGIIDLNKNLEARVLMKDRFTPPIDDPEWLKGFEEHLANK